MASEKIKDFYARLAEHASEASESMLLEVATRHHHHAAPTTTAAVAGLESDEQIEFNPDMHDEENHGYEDDNDQFFDVTVIEGVVLNDLEMEDFDNISACSFEDPILGSKPHVVD